MDFQLGVNPGDFKPKPCSLCSSCVHLGSCLCPARVPWGGCSVEKEGTGAGKDGEGLGAGVEQGCGTISAYHCVWQRPGFPS